MCSVLGYPVMVVSTISVKEPGTGIFCRALLAELKCIADEQNYILKIENVLPPLFRKYLIQEGFVFQVNLGCVVPAIGLRTHKYFMKILSYYLFKSI